MFCSQCGSENQPAARFCRKCGNALSSAPANETTNIQSQSMGARIYIVCVIVVALLIWGPLDHSWSWPAFFAIRTGYLIAIPVAAWFLLRWIWRMWQPDRATEDRFERALYAATAGVFVVLAILDGNADTHIGNTGDQAVGDPIVLPGPNLTIVCMYLLFAGFAFWFSVAKRESEP